MQKFQEELRDKAKTDYKFSQPAEPVGNRHAAGSGGLRLQGSRIVEPVVLRASRSRCACATSASG